MIKTGRINRITGEEILQAEVQDVAWEKEWEELTDVEICHYLSYKEIPLFGNSNREYVIALFNIERIFGLLKKGEWEEANKK